MVSLKQIHNFLVLAETLHFAKAALQLEISQATLSSEIKKMEKKLGLQLFDRSDKWSIKLTAAGQSYYAGIKNIPRDIALAHKNAIKSARGETGQLSVAVNSIAYDYINLGDICLQMKLQYPEVNLKVFDMPFALNRFECLTTGKADVAIFAGSNDLIMPEGFCARSIVPLNFALAVPRNSRLAQIENLQVNDLKQEHFILPPREEAPNLRNAWDQIFMEHCHTLPIVTQEVAGYYATLQFVAAGLGVGLLFMHKQNLLPEQVVLRELPVKMNRSILIGFPEYSNSPVIKNFLRILQTNLIYCGWL